MSFRPLLFSLAGLGLLTLASPGARADLQTEELRTVALAAKLQPHWVWVNDISFTRMIDGRAYLLDADSGKMLGMVSGGYSHTMLQLSPDGASFTVPATFYSRGSRGQRTDVVTLYDTKTLTPGDEVVIPPKRFGGLPFVGTMPLSDDGRFSLLYNFTPEQSVSVVDLKSKSLAGEFPTPGCGLIYPTGARSFFMQCGDGSLQSASLDEAGHVSLGAVSPKLFEANDPASEKAVRIGKADWLFFTFSGAVNEINAGGKMPVRGAKWSLTDAATAGWRPGGMQPFAYHAGSGRLYALMHQGGANTHKDPGGEVWVYDVKARKRVDRIKLDGLATSIAVSGDAKPLLYSVMLGSEDFSVYDAATGKKLRVIPGLGSTLTYIQPAPTGR